MKEAQENFEASQVLEQCSTFTADALREGMADADADYDIKCAKAQRLFILCQQIELDEAALCAAYLCAFSPISAEQLAKIKHHFSLSIADMVQGVAQMASISGFSKASQGTVSDENLRKMLIAMVNDVRVVLIKLADQVDRLRNIKNEPDEIKRETAQLTLDVYARLANRLGVWYLKWEMEDYALRYLEPQDYHHVAKELSEKRTVRETYIAEFIDQIEQKLSTAKLKAKVYGRPKHIYSIWRKMKLKGLSFNNILDIRAVRVLVDDIDQCYTALGLVHTAWPYLPGEFDDYIATPKPNGYQSIHTAVIGPDDKVVEVQIRTHAMHAENELGVAAHWRYKENTGKDQSIDNKIQWLRQLLEWKDDLSADEGLATQFDSETEETRIYVFTPKGRVIDLPNGATAIDFAYA
ncbi:MAG: HD domain-containing protein, partial [Arenicellales bacterium]